MDLLRKYLSVRRHKGHSFSIHASSVFVGLNIMGISAILTFLSVAFNWGGVCTTVLGATTQFSLWSEWLSTVPLLVYFTIAIVDKSELVWEDYAFITSNFLSILFGFLANFAPLLWVCLLLLAFSVLGYCPNFIMPSFLSLAKAETIGALKSSLVQKKYVLHIDKRDELAKWLVVASVGIPVIYFLSMFGLLSVAHTLDLLNLVSVVVKGYFVSTVTDVHMDIIIDAKELALIEEKRASKARRDFMKCGHIFILIYSINPHTTFVAHDTCLQVYFS